MSEENVETTTVETDTTETTENVDVTTTETTDTQDTTPDSDSTTDTTGDETESSDQSDYSEFNLPEGAVLDEKALAESIAIFKESGLTQEQSQKFVDLHTKLLQDNAQNQTDAFNQQVTDWMDQAKVDKEFGGDKFDENIKVAQTAVNKLGTPELKQLLDDYGVGNHPEIIRFMVKVGKMTTEDSPGLPGSVTTANDRVSLLYPNDRNDS